MIKILHTGDWHLDAPMHGRTAAQTKLLKKAFQTLPHKVAELCRQYSCNLLLLTGDIFDGNYTKESYQALYNTLDSLDIPVIITPGNHDFIRPGSPWTGEIWPENVHIFTHSAVEAIVLPALDCKIYGGGFTSMDCPALLADLKAHGAETYHIGVFHGDPTQINSPYNPITTQQVADSGLDYLALGHIHKGDSFRAGRTLCAWPGCPVGHGYDEQGQKGLLLTTIDAQVTTEFIPLDFPAFYDWEVPVTATAHSALQQVLPPVGNEDFYRITLTGTCEKPDLDALYSTFSRFPNLELRDRTSAPVDTWKALGEDSLEGIYFGLLKDTQAGKEGKELSQIELAAYISRQILDGQEVTLL